MSHRPALFLDRDGTINIDHGYTYKQNDFEFVEGIFELCRTAKKLGYLIFVVTNQAGIGRGYYSEKDFLKLTAWMCRVFNDRGIVIDNVYFCPYHPENGVRQYKVDSPNRKPRPGMILQAAEEFGVDLKRSVLVGDRETDIQAGLAAGVGCNLLFSASSSELSRKTTAAAVISNLSQVEPFIYKNAKNNMDIEGLFVV